MKRTNLSLRSAILLSTLALASLSLTSAKAEVINLTSSANNLYNTGVQADDSTLIAGDPTGNNNPADVHYSVLYYAHGSGGYPATVLPPTTYTTGFYGTPTSSGTAYVAAPTAVDSNYSPNDWVGNLSNSQWITYAPDMNTVVDRTPNSAVTVYQLSLTNIPQGADVTLGALVAADDSLTIYANGKELFSNFGVTDDGTNSNSNYNQFTTLSDLKFLAGSTNTLDFVVYNSGGYPTGLNAQLTGSYTVATPEPSTYALLLAGLGLLVYLRRRKPALAKV